MNELDRVRENLRRPPCWGPNQNGDYMVDMEVEAYERDLDRLVEAASHDLNEALAAQHRAMCEYSLIEERADMACTYTGIKYAPTEGGGDGG